MDYDAAIERCDREIASCEADNGPDRYGALWGEMDWRIERDMLRKERDAMIGWKQYLTYALQEQPSAMKCLLCDSVWTDERSVSKRYCAKCQRYHDHHITRAGDMITWGVMALRPDLSKGAQEALAKCLLEHCSPVSTPRNSEPQWSKTFRKK